MKKVVLSGIKPTGIAHIGNYFGALKPAVEMANNNEYECYYFIADYHALNYIKNSKELQENTKALVCTLLAIGMDAKNIVLYKQSDVPEVTELNWILSNVTPKGLLNRAHAYKAKVEEATVNGQDPDALVNMGLYNYPVLMAADILMVNSNFVPVGQDQKQHVEMARDIAGYFNKTYGANFVVPKEIISKDLGTIAGTDGRKMSKSYNNTIPLFAPEDKLKKLIMSIKTDSSLPTEPKPLDSAVMNLFKLFATAKEYETEKAKYENGLSWAEAKTDLFNMMNNYLSPMREKYNYYMENYAEAEKILARGAKKVQAVARETLQRTRIAVGID
ncbi:MAG: tryptophan--tRNA ligase [Clostridia bacterium]|nr:tryptophan--tRNA ligase [Clostridia bacterium]